MDYINFRIRITGGFFVGANDYVGPYLFKDGVSVEKLHRNEAECFSASIPCEALDENGNVAFPIYPGQVPASEDDFIFQDASINQAETSTEEEAEASLVAEQALEAVKEALNKPPLLDRKELEAIADKSGLAGLREYANPLGIKGKSIPELINKILSSQG